MHYPFDHGTLHTFIIVLAWVGFSVLAGSIVLDTVKPQLAADWQAIAAATHAQ